MLSIWHDRDFFGSPFSTWTRLHETPTNLDEAFQPASEVEETENHYLMHVDLPGVPKKDIDISFHDNVLTISGERKSEKANKHVTERTYGKFFRSFTLPREVNAEKIEASFEDGVLTVAIPKAESVKPKQIKISEGKSSFFGKLVSPKEETKKEATH